MIAAITSMDDQRLALLARVASLYYEDGMNQNEVAAILGYSRLHIPRMLAEARREGIVEIHIHHPLERVVALEQGVIVPVIHQADQKNLFQIGAEVSDLSRRAWEGGLRPQDVMGGTFAVSNLGMFAVDQFIAIINPP